MRPEDRQQFPPTVVTLKDGRSVTLRFLSVTDAAALGDFYESVPHEDFRFYGPHPLTRAEAAKKAARADGPNFVCLVADADEIAGYAWYEWREGAESSGFGTCIRRGWQECGLGGVLITRLLEIAAAIGPPVMHLTVQLANVRAVKLYRRMGFEVVREQTRPANPEHGFDEEPEYYMERRVR